MKVYNFNNKEVPILHFCGKSRDYHKRLFDGSGNEKIIIPKDISIITFCNKPLIKTAPLIKQLSQNGTPYLNPASKLVNWSNTWKPRLLLDCIDDIKTDYVLVLDSLDIKITGVISELIDRFNLYGKDVLFGACKSDFPIMTIEKIYNRDNLGSFNKLNVGTCFGKKQAIKIVYQTTVGKNLENNRYGSEQYMIRSAYDECQNFADFDYNCECFQTFINTTATPLDDEKQYWIVT